MYENKKIKYKFNINLLLVWLSWAYSHFLRFMF